MEHPSTLSLASRILLNKNRNPFLESDIENAKKIDEDLSLHYSNLNQAPPQIDRLQFLEKSAMDSHKTIATRSDNIINRIKNSENNEKSQKILMKEAQDAAIKASKNADSLLKKIETTRQLFPHHFSSEAPTHLHLLFLNKTLTNILSIYSSFSLETGEQADLLRENLDAFKVCIREKSSNPNEDSTDQKIFRERTATHLAAIDRAVSLELSKKNYLNKFVTAVTSSCLKEPRIVPYNTDKS